MTSAVVCITYDDMSSLLVVAVLFVDAVCNYYSVCMYECMGDTVCLSMAYLPHMCPEYLVLTHTDYI